jgi:hypothetical protein
MFHLFGQAKFLCWFGFRLEPIYTTAPATSKKSMLDLKVVKID